MLDSLQRAQAKHGMELWAWGIMPEHVHLLVWPTQAYSIAEFLRSLKAPVARKEIAFLHRTAPASLDRLAVEGPQGVEHRFWQAGPGFDENVIEPVRAHEITEYIHNNPVKRGLAAVAEDWRWSSARAWRGDADVLIPIQRVHVPALPVWERKKGKGRRAGNTEERSTVPPWHAQRELTRTTPPPPSPPRP